MIHGIIVTAAAPVSTSSALITAISTVGFPIVMCGILFWYIQTRTDKMAEALNANTLVMTKLLERMDKE
jgi:hypothetical protein